MNTQTLFFNPTVAFLHPMPQLSPWVCLPPPAVAFSIPAFLVIVTAVAQVLGLLSQA